MAKTLDAATKRRLAVAAECDPRSIDRYLRGELQRGTVAARVARALGELGLGHLVRAQSSLPANLAITCAPKSRA